MGGKKSIHLIVHLNDRQRLGRFINHTSIEAVNNGRVTKNE